MIQVLRVSFFTLFLLLNFQLASMAQNSAWLKRIGGEEVNIATSLLRNNAGELIMTGSFSYGDGRMQLGHITLVSEAPPHYRAGFIAKFDAEGQVTWAQALRSNRYGSIEQSAVDAAGNLYVVGAFHGELTFMDQRYTENSYSPQYFIAKYDAAGTPLWLRFLPGEATVHAKLAIDKQANLYIACSQGRNLGTSVEPTGLYLYKFDKDGDLLLERMIAPVSSTSPAYVYSLLVDANQQPIVAGDFLYAMQIEDQRFEGRGITEGFMVKYKADGSLKWAKHVGKGERFSTVADMTFDSEENIYLTGRFANKLDQMDVVLKYNPDGEQVQRISVNRYADTHDRGGLAGNTIKVSAQDGSIVVAGYFRDKVMFGNTELHAPGEETEHDVFVAKFEASGEVAGAIQSTGNGASSGLYLALTPQEHFYLAGQTVSSTLSFPNQQSTITRSSWDIFLYKEHISILHAIEETQPEPEEPAEEPNVYPAVVIPNIFTPNGDAKNQFFEIAHLDLSQNNALLIFNRWGKQVYQTKSYQNNWEATGLADGTYYYVLFLERENKYVKGWVNVVR